MGSDSVFNGKPKPETLRCANALTKCFCDFEIHFLTLPQIPVAVLGDSDYLMGSSALWTAARYKIPLLVIIANDARFSNDGLHPEQVAQARGRPVENKSIGIELNDPPPDVSQNAASYGVKVLGGQVRVREELFGVLVAAVNDVRRGATVLVDVRISPDE